MRPAWDVYFLSIARLVSTRATCDRKHVGTVLVDPDHQIISTGYNGALPGEPHCDEAGHDLVTLADGTTNCVRTQHAEVNCVAQAAKRGVSVRGATLYTTTYPCWPCARVVLSAGVRRIVYEGNYKNDPRVEAACAQAGVEVLRIV